LLSSISDGKLRPRFAGLDAPVPRVATFYVTRTSAVAEPRTAATATTEFAGFRDGAASGAYGIYSHRRHRGYDWFACLHALEPPVIYVFVAGTPTFVKPSTVRSATTDSAGFLECAALGAHHHVRNRGGDAWCAGCRGN